MIAEWLGGPMDGATVVVPDDTRAVRVHMRVNAGEELRVATVFPKLTRRGWRLDWSSVLKQLA